MAAVAGSTAAGLFGAAAAFLVRRGGSQKRLCLLLVLLCFTASMLITNDVALITFVPLTLLLLNSAEINPIPQTGAVTEKNSPRFIS